MNQIYLKSWVLTNKGNEGEEVLRTFHTFEAVWHPFLENLSLEDPTRRRRIWRWAAVRYSKIHSRFEQQNTLRIQKSKNPKTSLFNGNMIFRKKYHTFWCFFGLPSTIVVWRWDWPSPKTKILGPSIVLVFAGHKACENCQLGPKIQVNMFITDSTTWHKKFCSWNHHLMCHAWSVFSCSPIWLLRSPTTITLWQAIYVSLSIFLLVWVSLLMSLSAHLFLGFAGHHPMSCVWW